MTRKRRPPTQTAARRPRARMPIWAVAALVLLAAAVAFGRIGPFGTDTPTAAPVLTTPAQPTALVPTATHTTQADAPPAARDIGGAGAASPTGAAILTEAELARVVRIVDGDTIEVEIDGARRRVRYIGIDTPERDQPGFAAATQANRVLVENQTLYLVRDQSDTDVFDRLLRYLYLADGTHVNATLIAQGWAQPVEYRPDVRHAQTFLELALQAADARAGFWSGQAVDNEPAMPYGLTVNEAAVRRGPDTRFAVNITLPPRTPLSIYGRTPDGAWLQVRPPSRGGGWLPAADVDMRVPIAEIFVPDDIPE